MNKISLNLFSYYPYILVLGYMRENLFYLLADERLDEDTKVKIFRLVQSYRNVIF